MAKTFTGYCPVCNAAFEGSLPDGATADEVKAAASYNGWQAVLYAAAAASNKLGAIIEELRTDKNYVLSDELRDLRKDLDKSISYAKPSPRS